jgi:hypothetical protein
MPNTLEIQQLTKTLMTLAIVDTLFLTQTQEAPADLAGARLTVTTVQALCKVTTYILARKTFSNLSKLAVLLTPVKPHLILIGGITSFRQAPFRSLGSGTSLTMETNL